ncbi:MAG: RusA family crossover junction endodeoxyribonuclease [Rickettsiales bacterium]|nr:RusA family crossover junction endodeoxyribonuclease [Rickettsiales bacterium]
MKNSIRITLAEIPVAKGRGKVGVNRATGRGMIFTPAKTKAYESKLRDAASDAMAGLPPFDEPLAVYVDAFVPVPPSWSQRKQVAALAGVLHPQSRPDLDNYVKAALDALNGVVYRDDNLVIEMTARKQYSSTPRIEIEVMPLSHQKRMGLLTAPKS